MCPKSVSIPSAFEPAGDLRYEQCQSVGYNTCSLPFPWRRDLRTVSNLIAFYMPLLNDDNLKRSSKKPGSAALCIFLNLGLCHVISDIIIIIIFFFIIIIKNVKIKVTLCELTLQGHFTFSTLHSQKTKPVNFQHSWQAPTGSDTSYMAFGLPDF